MQIQGRTKILFGGKGFQGKIDLPGPESKNRAWPSRVADTRCTVTLSSSSTLGTLVESGLGEVGVTVIRLLRAMY